MAEHPNVLLMCRATEAFSKGDMDGLRAMFDEDATWHVPGRSPVSGNYKGHSQIFAYFGKLAQLTGGTFKVEMHDCVGNDQHVVGLDRLTATRLGKTLDINLGLVVHVRDGKILEGWDLFSDQYAWDEFWS